LVLAAPLLVAGFGCSLVISANLTLTLLEITRARAGVAAAIYETCQRIGTALGAVRSSAAFFGELAATGGDYSAAVGFGLTSPAVFIGIVFLISTADMLWPVHRRQASGDIHAAN
jgi:hypothetical protein